jgi:hypothetical protein
MSSPTSLFRRLGHGTGALLFAGGVLVGLLAGELIRPPRAVAQIPDQGMQLLQVQQAAAQTNRLLKEVVDVLRTETLKVRIVEPDKSGRSAVQKVEPKR